MRVNLRNSNLKVKLFSFAGLAILLVATIVATGLFSYSRIERSNASIEQANQRIEEATKSIEAANKSIETADKVKTQINEAVKKVMALRLAEKTYLQFYTSDLKDGFDTQARQIADELLVLKDQGIANEFQEYRKTFEEYVDIQAQDVELKMKMAEPLKESEKLLKSIIGELEEKEQLKQIEGEALDADEAEMMNVSRDCQIVFLKLQNIQQQYLTTGNGKYIDEYKQLADGNVQTHLTSLTEFSSVLQNDNFIKNSKTIKGSLDQFMDYIEKSLTFTAQENELIDLLNKRGGKIIESAEVLLSQADQSVAEAQKRASMERDKAMAARNSAGLAKKAAMVAKSQATTVISIIVGAGILFFSFLSFILFRSIINPINNAIKGLEEGSDQVASASAQISTASQQLAEGASDQAASTEETSASLEQMASMTRQNAENAKQADYLMKESRRVVVSANESMGELTTSMEDISKSSKETSKIIKTIDEISFQTNLLALNAAVEAARAGEAGAGFAVVADEVRSLAMRAAEESRNTASLIEDTLKKVKHGSELVLKTNKAFDQVAAGSAKVAALVSEIAAASTEQAQGIDQLNKAVNQIDRVVQQNSANAEESASASQTMSALAGKMKAMVMDLMAMAGGKHKDGGRDINFSGTVANEEETAMALPT